MGVGSNIDPEANILAGIRRLAAEVRLTGTSTFRLTDPVGPPGQPPFVNGVVAVATKRAPRDLKFGVLRPIEASLGRVRGADRFAPRPLDLDLLLYDDVEINDSDLVLPDPDVATRSYIRAALLELDPSMDLGETTGGGTRLALSNGPEGTPMKELTELIRTMISD